MRIQPKKRILHREQVPVGLGEGLFAKRLSLAAFPYNLHNHPECELAVVTSGRGLRHVGDSVAPFAPGDFCLIGPGVPHTWESQPGPVGSLVVQFNPAVFAGWRDCPEGASLDRLLRRSAATGAAYAGARRQGGGR